MLSFRGGSPFGDAIPFGVALCGQEADSKRITPDKRFIGAKIVNPAIMRGRGLGIISECIKGKIKQKFATHTVTKPMNCHKLSISYINYCE